MTILSRSRFLKESDKHLRALAIKELAGVTIRRIPGNFDRGQRSGSSVQIPDGDLETDAIFLAAGLMPKTGSLENLEKGRLDEVVVDNRMRTSVPDVYACGDVVGPPYLTQIARHQGIVAADNILGLPRTMDYKNIPHSISLTHRTGFLHQQD